MSRLKDLRQTSVRTYCGRCECVGPLGAHRCTPVITLLHVCPSRRFLLVTGTMCFISYSRVGPVVVRAKHGCHTLLQSRAENWIAADLTEFVCPANQAVFSHQN